MARPLVPSLLNAMLGETRKPAFKIEVYDIRSTSTEVTPTRVNDVVLFNQGGPVLPTIVGPRDFTADVQQVEVTEVAGDYAQNGVAATDIKVVVSDDDGDFDPVENPPTALLPMLNGRWLRQKNVVVLYEGDLDTPEADWPATFTGSIEGQPGYSRNRTTGEAIITFKCASREVDFLRRSNTTRNFAQNSAYQTIAEEIAETDMGLDLDEINLPTFSARLTAFVSTQFVEESPLVSISKLMLPDGFMPRFQGDGRLGSTSGSITKGPTRFFPENSIQTAIVRPMLELNGVNEVEVIGLDPNMEAVTQQEQELARVSITTGFFTSTQDIQARWSDDLTQQAFDVRMEVDSSVEDGIFNFGSESFANNPNPTDGGSVDGVVSVDGGLAASVVLFTLITSVYVAEANIPDAVQVGPSGTGFTASIGRLAQAATGQAIFTLLASIGYGRYRIVGRPYEYVFREIRTVARIEGVRSEDRQGITIENHLINSTADCDAVAERVLRRERAKQNRRTVTMIHDLALEPDDVFELGASTTARRYMINSIKRTLVRGGQHVATLDCFEVTPGVRP